MAFAFSLPDPDSSFLVESRGEDGVVETSATPELAGAIDAVIAAQTEALSAVMGGVADTIQRQLVFQQQALGEQQRAIQQTVTQQLAGQRAALDVAMHAVADGVTQTLARQREDVGATAVAAAMQPRQPAPPPYTAPSAPPTLQPLPPAPWRGKTGGGGPFSSPNTTVTSPQAPTPRTQGMTTQVVTPPPPGQTELSAYLTPVTPAAEVAGQSGGAVPPEPQVAAWSGTVLSPLPPQPYTPPLDQVVEPEGGAQGAGGGPAQGGAAQGSCPPPTVQVMPCASPVTLTVNVDGVTQSVTVVEQQPPPLPPRAGRQIQVLPEEDEAKKQREKENAGCPWTLDNRIPAIGSEEWCRDHLEVIAAIAKAGTFAIELLLKPVDLVASALELPADVRQGVEANAKKGDLLGVASRIMLAVSDAGTWVRDAVKCWKGILGLLAPCDPGTMLGVAAFRALVRAFSNLRMGTDAGAWATVDVHLDLPGIERVTTYILESLCPSILPTAEQAWTAFTAGEISEDTWKCWTLSAGQDPTVFRGVREAHGHSLDWRQTIFWSRIMGGDAHDADAGLYARGWTRGLDRRVIQAMYDAPADGRTYMAWHFAGADEVAVEAILRRDDGFRGWWDSRPGELARAYGMGEETARLTWRSSQYGPGPDDMRRLVRLLRTDRPDRGPEFTIDTMRQLLQASAMAPAAVEWAMQTVTEPIPTGAIHDLVRHGRTGYGDIRGIWRDAGMTAEDASSLALAQWHLGQREFYGDMQGWTIDAVATLVRAGVTPPAAATYAMEQQGWDAAAVTQTRQTQALTGQASAVIAHRQAATEATASAARTAYRANAISAALATRSMVAAGYEPAVALALLAAEDVSATAERVTRSIAHIEAGVMAGELSLAQGQIVLSRIGVPAERIQTISSAWAIERLATRPMARVREIRRWVSEGLLTLQAARTRLANMGWRDPDLTLQLQEMGQALARAQAAARTSSAAAKAAAAKAAEQVKQQALRALERQRPVGALAQWYLDGLLGPTEVRERMRQYGYTDASIDLYLHGWDHKARARAAATGGAVKGTAMTPQRQVPIGQIRAWYLDGIVDRAWADARLTGYGYDDESRGGYLLQWDNEKAARAAKRKATDGAGHTAVPHQRKRLGKVAGSGAGNGGADQAVRGDSPVPGGALPDGSPSVSEGG